MIKCPYCGKSVEEEGKCPSCHAELPKVKKPIIKEDKGEEE